MYQRRQLLAACAAMLAAPALRAQPLLDQVRLLSGFPAAGTVDASARVVAERLRGTVARVALVDNRAGASGRIAVDELRRSAPDGSTLLMSPTTVFTLYPHILRKLSYTLDDVVPVCGAVSLDLALAVGPLVPASVRTLKDFIAWCKASAGGVSYGSPGAGSTTHLLAALLGKEAGVDLNHVAYRGAAPAMQDLLGGQIAAVSLPLGDGLPHQKSGRVRILATSGAARSRHAPDVPTYTEQGYGALAISPLYGVFAPRGTPAAVVERLAAGVAAGLERPESAAALGALGLDVSFSAPAEFAKLLRADSALWPGIVKRLGYTPED